MVTGRWIPPSRKEEKEEKKDGGYFAGFAYGRRYGCDHSFRGNHTKPQQPQCRVVEPLITHTLACNGERKR